MVGRFIIFILIVGSLLLAWKSGVLESIRSGAVPEEGRQCVVNGPLRAKGVPGALDPETLGKEIDSHVGAASSKRLAGAMGLQSLFDNGELASLAAFSKVKVIENGSVLVQGMPYKIVKVCILDGKLKDTELWVERVNLIDTPIQALFQSIRQQQNNSSTAPPQATSESSQ